MFDYFVEFINEYILLIRMSFIRSESETTQEDDRKGQLNIISWNKVAIGILLLLTLSGLFLKFQYAMQRSLTSDDVFHGIIAHEFWVNGDYLFENFFFFSADPDLFTGFIIHVLPQVLSDFSPDVLRLISLVIVGLIIIVYGAIIWHFTRNYIPVFLFSALFAVGTPDASMDSIIPKSHIVTILGIGIFLYFLFVKKWVHGRYLFITLLCLAFLMISDSITAIWLTAPVFLMHFFVPACRNLITRQIAALIMSVSLFFFFIKNFIPTWWVFFRKPVGATKDWGLHFDGIAQALVSLLFPGINIPSGTGWLVLLVPLISFVGYLLVIYLEQWRKIDRSESYFGPETAFLWYSGICITFCLFSVSLLAFETALRYLSIIPVLLYCIIAIFFSRSERQHQILSIILISLIFFSLLNSVQSVGSLSEPNVDEHKLISLLSQQKITHAYADYWDATVTTYLASGSVTIRPVKYEEGIIQPFLFLSSRTWFPQNFSRSESFVLITRNSSPTGNLSHIPSLYPADETYTVEPYTVSVYKYPHQFKLQNGEYSTVNAFYRILRANGMWT